MRNLITVAAIAMLAAITANCNSHEGTNSASNVLPMASLVGPSMLEARGGNGGGNGNGNGGGNSNQNPVPPDSLTLVVVNDIGADGASWGDTITFTAVTSATDPHVTLACYQNGMLVLSTWAPYVASSPQQWTLSTPSWQSGGADCTAKLQYFSGSKDVVLATTSFYAAAN